jgi:prevent-host-death family protein
VNPTRKGALAETAITAHAVELGFTVLRPVTEGERYDLVFGVRRTLLRVQCKWACRRGDAVVVNARTSRRSADGHVRGTYSSEEVDLIAAYCHELRRCFAVPVTEFGPSGQLWLRLAPARNGQLAGLHFAEQYDLGAIAQLEERLHGMQEVAGSSPASSTPSGPTAVTVGSHEFRNRFGWYMERSAAGAQIVVTHRGRPRIRVGPAEEPPFAPEPPLLTAARACAGARAPGARAGVRGVARFGACA